MTNALKGTLGICFIASFGTPQSHFPLRLPCDLCCVLWRVRERGAGNERAVIAMFTLILAAFYFILDIDSGENGLKALLGPMFSCT